MRIYLQTNFISHLSYTLYLYRYYFDNRSRFRSPIQLQHSSASILCSQITRSESLSHQCDVVVDVLAVQRKGFPVALGDVILPETSDTKLVVTNDSTK